MASSMRNTCVEQWRLCELTNILDSIEDDIASAISDKQIKTGNDYCNIVLRAMGKAIVSMREIICLVSCGYPDGASSISRNLYEQLIILAFFEGKHQDRKFQDYIEDYCIDYDIQRCNALIYECKNCFQNPERLTELTQELTRIKSSAHKSTDRGTYWWAGYSSFSNLTKAVIKSMQEQNVQFFLHRLHLHYKRACVALHASCIGNTLRLGGNPDFAGIDTTPSEKGHALPLWFATVSLGYILGVAFSVLELDYENYEQTLNGLSSFYDSKERD